MEKPTCPECGAPAGGREGCQRLFDEVIAREFGNYRYGRIHRLTVDAYSLQHPDEYMRSAKSYAAHLTGMHAALDMDAPAAETNRTVQQWLSASTPGERPDQPAAGRRGSLTVAHVHEAMDAGDHVRRVREWAESTWKAWQAWHQTAERWVAQAVSAQGARRS